MSGCWIIDVAVVGCVFCDTGLPGLTLHAHDDGTVRVHCPSCHAAWPLLTH